MHIHYTYIHIHTYASVRLGVQGRDLGVRDLGFRVGLTVGKVLWGFAVGFKSFQEISGLRVLQFLGLGPYQWGGGGTADTATRNLTSGLGLGFRVEGLGLLVSRQSGFVG